MPQAFRCDAIRTPVRRYGGALASVRPDDLAAAVLRALLQRYPGAAASRSMRWWSTAANGARRKQNLVRFYGRRVVACQR